MYHNVNIRDHKEINGNEDKLLSKIPHQIIKKNKDSLEADMIDVLGLRSRSTMNTKHSCIVCYQEGTMVPHSTES